MRLPIRVLGVVCLLGVAGAAQTQDDTLTETERLQLALHQTQIQLERALAEGAMCRASLRGAQLSDDQSKLKALVEAAHPGFVLDVNTGLLSKKPSL